ncbi:hypothetical protein DPMN_095752 [Dreissena polymorpha]|uniref:Uncharacterized protein n=1 Tax=Dreissena polymorpha TaxID=45954 RepID=A0A9D4R368_DREPO|nr:hypothetical protein DPMN_095752 [Dreissena polymorpha]
MLTRSLEGSWAASRLSVKPPYNRRDVEALSVSIIGEVCSRCTSYSCITVPSSAHTDSSSFASATMLSCARRRVLS